MSSQSPCFIAESLGATRVSSFTQVHSVEPESLDIKASSLSMISLKDNPSSDSFISGNVMSNPSIST